MKTGSFARFADIMSRTQRDSLNVNMPQGDSRGEASIQKCGFKFCHSPRGGVMQKSGAQSFARSPRFFEGGRSMIEMLAVLAIVAVLSLVLLLGYIIAMNKYRANEIIAGVKLRAYAVSWQPREEPGTEQDLTEFAEKILTYKTTAWAGGLNGEEDLFTIDVDDVQQGVCQEILNRNWTLPAGIFVFDQKVSTCPDENAQMAFVFPVDLEDEAEADEQNPCYGKGPCCEVISEEDRTIRVGKRLARRTCQTSTNGLVCCTSGPLVCMYDADEITKYEPFQDTEATCTGNFACDGLTCGCAQSCGAGQTQDSTTCACSCIDTTQEVWNGKCVPKCEGEGMTRQRDENGQCICEAGLIFDVDTNTCKCKEGYIYVDGACQEFHCEESSYASNTYICYLNGAVCGTSCKTATPKNKEDCSGYCYPNFCPTNTHWFQATIPWSGFGCYNPEDATNTPEESRGLYCGTFGDNKWICINWNDSAGNVCCEADSFALCTRGACKSDVCNDFGGEYTYVADRFYGCKITKNERTAYCVPYDGDWVCLYTAGANVALDGSDSNPNFCGRCSAAGLKDGNCGNCFSETKECPKWDGVQATYNADLDRCVGTLDETTMSCDFSGNCYVGASETSNRCAYGCNDIKPGNDPVCNFGMCDESGCPTGSKFVHQSKVASGLDSLDIYGCQTTQGGYTLFYKDGTWGHQKACYIITGTDTDATASVLCGTQCEKNCSSCGVYYHKACSSGKCPKNGSLIDENNDGVADCVCEGTVTNKHCCEVGHVYLNGGCTQLSCPAGQCVTEGGLCTTLTTNLCRDDSGLCQMVSETLTRDDSGYCVINQG